MSNPYCWNCGEEYTPKFSNKYDYSMFCSIECRIDSKNKANAMVIAQMAKKFVIE